MAFFVHDSWAGVRAWDRGADVGIFWGLANCNLVRTCGSVWFWRRWGQFLAVRANISQHVMDSSGFYSAVKMDIM